jgi:dihydroorotate dehydrogenase electron transfer subunit
MSQFQQKVEVVQAERITGDVVRLTLSAPEIAAVAKPGQFVMVQTNPGMDPLLRRPFSIHQIGSDGRLQILFKVVGKGTQRLARIRAGEHLSLLGPLGNGFVVGAPETACLIGGGMGIAPMLFLASHFLHASGKNSQKKDSLVLPRVILGARNRAELEPLIRDFQDLGLEVLAATDDGSLGHHGLVTDVLRKINLSPLFTVYCCGPRPMMAAIAQLCRQESRGCQVSVETVMACGIGACLGCAVPLKAGGYAHVCSDGPVFEAEKLLWSL